MSSLNHDSPLRVVLARRHSVHEIRKASVQTLLCESDTPDVSDIEPSRPEPSPLYHLIPEILYKIFTFIRDSDHDEIRDCGYPFRMAAAKWNWINVSHVCRYWRNTALDFPLLWSHLINFSDIEKSKVFLERSKGSPLRVCFRSGVRLDDSIDNVEVKQLDCLLEALLHMERISYLDVFICITPVQTDVRQNFQRLLSRRSPYLHTIKFQVIVFPGLSFNFLELPFQIPENTPTLKRLSLASFSWPANMPLAANLLELTLSSVTGVSLRNFLTALRSCPDLETLAIDNVYWVAESPSANSSMDETVTYLRHLRSMDITFDEDITGVNKRLPRLLRTPDNASWSFCFTAEHWRTLFAANFFEFIRDGRDTLVCVEEEILVTPTGCSILSQNFNKDNQGVYLIRRDLQINFEESISTKESLTNITSLINANHWRRAQTVKIGLTLTPEIIEEEHWSLFFPSLPAIRNLDIDIEEEGEDDRVSDSEELKTNTENILETLLSGKDATPLSDGTVHCQDLRSLSVTIQAAPTNNLASLLRRGLQSRSQSGIGLDSLSIRTEHRTRNAELEALSDLVKDFSYTRGRAKSFLENDYLDDYYDNYMDDDIAVNYLENQLVDHLHMNWEEQPDWVPPVSDEAQVDSEEEPPEIEEEIELELEPEPEKIVRRRSI